MIQYPLNEYYMALMLFALECELSLSLCISQLARNVGNSGFNEILEANLLSPSLKPSQHSHM